MKLFRSKVVAALIALFMVGGVLEKAVGCCETDAVEHSESTGPSHSEDHQCHCVCHQAFVSQYAAPELRGAFLAILLLVLESDDFPPDSIPVGIDHPPQLA